MRGGRGKARIAVKDARMGGRRNGSENGKVWLAVGREGRRGSEEAKGGKVRLAAGMVHGEEG